MANEYDPMQDEAVQQALGVTPAPNASSVADPANSSPAASDDVASMLTGKFMRGSTLSDVPPEVNTGFVRPDPSPSDNYDYRTGRPAGVLDNTNLTPEQMAAFTGSLSGQNATEAPASSPLQELLAKLPVTDRTVASQSAPVAAPKANGMGKAGQPMTAPALPPQATPTSISDMVSKLLSDKGLGDDSLKRAQDQADYSRYVAGMEKAGNLIASGFSRGADTAHNESADDLIKGANVPVDQILQRRDALAKQTDMGLKLSDLNDKEEMRNPNSATSQRLAQMAVDMHIPGIQMGMSGESIIKAAPILDTYLKMKNVNALREQTMAMKTMAFNAQQEQRQNMLMQHVAQAINTSRGQPAIAQAEKDLYAAQKANTLMNMYGSPDKLNPQMAKLVVNEIGKIATGGQASEGELNAITPPMLAGPLQNAWQAVSREPSPAHLGAFLKQYQDYANGVSRDAQGAILGNYNRVIGPWQGFLTPDRLTALKASSLNRFDQGDAPINSAMSAPSVPKPAPNGHASVQQNGVTYNWNPATGRYE